MFFSVWTLLVCMSRMYLGMHSLGDVLTGVLLSIVILPPVLTFVHLTDTHLVSDPWSPVTTMLLSITAIIIFPCRKWSPSAATAVDVLGCYQGVILGQWCLHSGHVGSSWYRTDDPTCPPAGRRQLGYSEFSSRGI